MYACILYVCIWGFQSTAGSRGDGGDDGEGGWVPDPSSLRLHNPSDPALMEVFLGTEKILGKNHGFLIFFLWTPRKNQSMRVPGHD